MNCPKTNPCPCKGTPYKPITPVLTKPCEDCLITCDLIVAIEDSVEGCGNTITVDIGTENDYSACDGPLVLTILDGYDTGVVAGITGDENQLTITSGNKTKEYTTIQYLIECPSKGLSILGCVIVIFKPGCKAIENTTEEITNHTEENCVGCKESQGKIENNKKQ